VLVVFVAVGARVLEVELVELPPASVTVVEVIVDTEENTRFVLIVVAESSADRADGMVITRAIDLNLLFDKVELAEATTEVYSIIVIDDSDTVPELVPNPVPASAANNHCDSDKAIGYPPFEAQAPEYSVYTLPISILVHAFPIQPAISVTSVEFEHTHSLLSISHPEAAVKGAKQVLIAHSGYAAQKEVLK
jgi:hypothetical protein